jgi:hypothetical protein
VGRQRIDDWPGSDSPPPSPERGWHGLAWRWRRRRRRQRSAGNRGNGAASFSSGAREILSALWGGARDRVQTCSDSPCPSISPSSTIERTAPGALLPAAASHRALLRPLSPPVPSRVGHHPTPTVSSSSPYLSLSPIIYLSILISSPIFFLLDSFFRAPSLSLSFLPSACGRPMSVAPLLPCELLLQRKGCCALTHHRSTAAQPERSVRQLGSELRGGCDRKQGGEQGSERPAIALLACVLRPARVGRSFHAWMTRNLSHSPTCSHSTSSSSSTTGPSAAAAAGSIARPRWPGCTPSFAPCPT